MSSDYQWYKEHGICPKCGQRDAFCGHVFCPECLEKISLRNIARYENPEKMAKHRESNRRSAAKRRAERITSGLCVTCGRPADHGTMCEWCAARKRRYQQKYRRSRNDYHGGPGAIFQARMDAGLCMYCGRPQVPGYKYCEEHLIPRQEHARQMGRERVAKIKGGVEP